MQGVWERAEKDVVIHGGRMNVTESCLDRHAKETPDKIALVFEDENGRRREYSYAKLLGEVVGFANLLKSSGIKRGSRVFIFLPKCPELCIALLGAIRHGSVAAPLFEAFQQDGLVARLKNGEAGVLVTNRELSKRLPGGIASEIPSLRNIFITDSRVFRKAIGRQKHVFAPVMRGRKDTALMIFTSSTAGTPLAGIELPHYALVQQHMTASCVLGLGKDSRCWCTAHPGWVTGSVYGIIAPLSVGCASYVYQGRFDAKKWCRFLVRNEIDVMYTAPTALRMLRGEISRSNLAGLKGLCSVGEALTGAVFDFYKHLGSEITDTYWQTETGAIMIAGAPGIKKKSGAIGKAVPGVAARTKNGRIVFRPGWPSMMTGIYKHNKMYRSYFRNGWFCTNDMARMDREGYFHFEGRGGDMIKTSGERVSPVEIESALMRHRAVQEAAVIGVPDRVRGEIIKAFVVLGAGFAPEASLKQDISSFVRQHYAGHSYPKEIEFVKALPKTNSGKVIRMELRRTHGN